MMNKFIQKFRRVVKRSRYKEEPKEFKWDMNRIVQ